MDNSLKIKFKRKLTLINTSVKHEETSARIEGKPGGRGGDVGFRLFLANVYNSSNFFTPGQFSNETLSYS